MADKLKVFVSTVTSQFKDCRDALASDLRAIGCEVKVQEDFQQGPDTLIAKIEEADTEGIAEPTARLANDLGLLLLSQGQWKEAEPLMRQALAIDESSYGTEHPSVVRDLISLALLMKATILFVEAEPLIRRALAIDVSSYGEEHSSVLEISTNLAALLQEFNQL